MNTRVLLVMGVSGSGKTALGQRVADELGWVFADADDYHSSANRLKMARGEALTDEDRWPWLNVLHELIRSHVVERRSMVLACSALKASYRNALIQDLDGISVIFLSGDRQVLEERMRHRNHFMPIRLLDSQLATLEPPETALVLNIKEPLENLVQQVLWFVNNGLPLPH
jgi:gluconokinase